MVRTQKSNFDVLDLFDLHPNNSHEHGIQLRLEMENIVKISNIDEKTRLVSLEIIKHCLKSYNELLAKFVAPLLSLMTKKLRVTYCQQQQIFVDQVKFASQLNEIKAQDMLFAMSTINVLSKVDTFNYKLNVHVVDRAIIVDRREKTTKKTCRDVNKIIRVNFSIVNFLRGSHIGSNS